MLGLNNHDNAPRFENVHHGVGNLTGHSLLYLRTPRVNIDQPGQLGQAGYLPTLIRNISDMSITKEGCQVMLAGGEHLDIPHQHHLVVIGIEHGGKHGGRLLAQAGELFGEGASDPARGVLKTVPLRVLANGVQDLKYRSLYPAEIDLIVQFRGPNGPPSSGPWPP